MTEEYKNIEKELEKHEIANLAAIDDMGGMSCIKTQTTDLKVENRLLEYKLLAIDYNKKKIFVTDRGRSFLAHIFRESAGEAVEV